MRTCSAFFDTTVKEFRVQRPDAHEQSNVFARAYRARERERRPLGICLKHLRNHFPGSVSRQRDQRFDLRRSSGTNASRRANAHIDSFASRRSELAYPNARDAWTPLAP